MQDGNPVSMLLNHSVKLIIPVGNSNDKPSISEPCAKAISSLMYAALGTQPDISFVVQYLSQFMHCFANEHWTAIKHVFQYLKGTKYNGITYKAGNKIEIEVFADADFANCADTLNWQLCFINQWKLHCLEFKETKNCGIIHN
jgi:hypothetical protein